MLYRDTQATRGRGQAIVVATGSATVLGGIAQLTGKAQEAPTPLTQRLRRLGRTLVILALVLFALVTGLDPWRGLPATGIIMVAVSQVVSMVPEGLHVAMTVALAVGMQRMAVQGAIVRRLADVETLGSVNCHLHRQDRHVDTEPDDRGTHRDSRRTLRSHRGWAPPAQRRPKRHPKSSSATTTLPPSCAPSNRAGSSTAISRKSLKKVLLYLFSTSASEVVVLLTARVAGMPLPLAAIQILWINIMTDGTVTINLILEPLEGGEMQRPPVPRYDPLLSRMMLHRMRLMITAMAT